MDLFEAIKDRRSVRNFSDEQVDEKDLNKILSAANEAPSARNKQPWRFIVVKNKEVSIAMATEVKIKLDLARDKALSENNEDLLARTKRYRTSFTFFQNAPVTVAIVMIPYEGTGIGIEVGEDPTRYNSALQSVAAAIQNFLLAAHSLGYGSCWMTGPLIARPEISRILDIKDDELLVSLLPLGKYKIAPKKKDKKSLDDVVSVIE